MTQTGESPAPAGGAQQSIVPTVEYTISMLMPHTHYFDIEILLKQGSGDSVSFIMPVWTPGSYSILEFERNVQDFRALDGRSNPLRWEKTEKNVWKVWAKQSPRLRVRYRVYAYQMRVDMSYLDAEHARINPASVLMYVEGPKQDALLVNLVPHPSWKQISTGLRTRGRDKLSFLASNYDELVDSPIVLGNYEVRSFNACKKRHDVAMVGAGGTPMGAFVADLRKIVEAAVAVYGEAPYDRYAFLIEFTKDLSGGLEHLNSTCCLFSKLLLQPEQVYHRALGIFSHEFFHLWNVKRMRPLELGPFDYTKENYTRSLWIAEGITSYYQDIILRRAGLYTVPEYLGALADQLSSYLATPGRKAQSAEESSFDSWIKFSRPDENSINNGVSYYTKGAILGWMIDMEIRRATKSKKTLDHVMRKVYADGCKSGRGYTEEEFQKACELMADKSMNTTFEKYVRSKEEIDFDRYLGYAGLQLGVHPQEISEDPRGFLGVRLKAEVGRLVIDSVLADTPAYGSGLYARDSIVAVDGLATDEKELAFYVGTRKPGSPISMTVSRDGNIRRLRVKVGKRPQFLYRISAKEKTGIDEKLLFENWLGEPWKTIKYREWGALPEIRAMEWLFFKPDFL